MTRLLRLCRSALLSSLVMLAATFPEAQAVPPLLRPNYRVICNISNPVVIADRRFLQDAFMKRVTVWPTGQVIRPVDLPATSPVRRLFTEDVLKRPLDAVRNFWQQRIFAGHELPPPELSSDDEVVRFVAKEPGAVGYVSGDRPLRGVKSLSIRW